MKKGKVIVILILLFIASILIRLPNLNRPLSKHHEFITAVSLRVLQIWDKDDPSNYHFAPVMNYPGEANKWINNHASPSGKMVDDKGNYYYISHPPFAYLLPHYTFQLFNIKPTVLSLQLFLVFCGFVTGVFVYLISLEALTNKPEIKRQQLGIIAYSIYMFSPAVLWFQGNTYMSDILVHTFFASTIYFLMKAINSNGSYRWIAFFSVSLFFMIYTSWLGVFMAISIVILGLFTWKNKDFKQLIVPAIVVSIISVGIIVIQYSSICGLENFIDQIYQRLAVRGSISSENVDPFFLSKLKELGLLLMNYGILYFPLILLIFYGLVSHRKGTLSINKWFVFTAIFPIVLLHFALMNYSGHDFTSLYASIVLSILSGVFIVNFSRIKRRVVLTFIFIFSISSYYFVNRPGQFSWKGDEYAKSMNQGVAIKNKADAKKVIFYITEELDPMLIVYAERNIIPVTNEDEIHRYLDRMKFTDWQLIDLNKGEE